MQLPWARGSTTSREGAHRRTARRNSPFTHDHSILLLVERRMISTLLGNSYADKRRVKSGREIYSKWSPTRREAAFSRREAAHQSQSNERQLRVWALRSSYMDEAELARETAANAVAAADEVAAAAAAAEEAAAEAEAELAAPARADVEAAPSPTALRPLDGGEGNVKVIAVLVAISGVLVATYFSWKEAERVARAAERSRMSDLLAAAEHAREIAEDAARDSAMALKHLKEERQMIGESSLSTEPNSTVDSAFLLRVLAGEIAVLLVVAAMGCKLFQRSVVG